MGMANTVKEFDAYNENFVSDTPNGEGKFAWLVRVYSYAPESGFIGSWKGSSASHEEGKAAAKAEAEKQLEKYRRPPA